jgi:hypothetical protein
MCATGAANSMWPILSLRTIVSITSTPHFSQTLPANLDFLYLPQEHSKSLVGPKITSSNKPPRSGFKVL